ncbi:NACHT, LRR and PYD domains-containing protein 2 [Eptesicus fuscus]|uniref:NACHT, LRR and PYD domains-containing protein 2 n=1 Tax=Eptesicus fuscus TaxID=29078 RepID=UPI0024044E21|nr:NACHT, LRR and PYD domains-containing protein 2 [Eptesicus fuscus]
MTVSGSTIRDCAGHGGAPGPVPSAKMDFNLRSLLEQLELEELSKFKSLLRTLPPQDELQHVSQTEVDEASGQQLAEILTTRCPVFWVEMVTIQVFDKMNRTDLSKRAKDELREAALKSLQENELPLELTQAQGGSVTNPEDIRETSEGETPGQQDTYSNIWKTSGPIWKQSPWPEAHEHVPSFTQRYERLVPFCNPSMRAGPFPHTVVLQGAAGVGKTTLAKKWMLDWAQDHLPETLHSAFYLSCKGLGRQGACTFAELLARKCPDAQEAGPQVLALGQKVLVVIDGFDELRVPSGSLIHDICGDWKAPKPVPVLLGSLLKRKLLPKATLLVTTRPEALGELRPLLDQPLLIEAEGFLEADRRGYFLRHFEQRDQALRAFRAMQGSPALFPMGAAPAVCWVVCTCLKGQLEKGEDPASTCRTPTSLFLRFLCGQCPPAAPGRGPAPRLPTALQALSLLAAQGVWAQTSLFDGQDLGRLGVGESDLRPFLDGKVLQADADCEGCYAFLHLSVQQFLAALFYLLDGAGPGDAGGCGCAQDVGDVRALLSKEERLRNPSLTRVGHFLFGLANEERARELEATFGCRVSLDVRRELLRVTRARDWPFSSRADTRELMRCLYESQEEALVREALAPVTELALHLQSERDLVQASFCLRHSQALRGLSLQVEKGIFLENDGIWEPGTWAERSRSDQHLLPFWMDLCAVLGSKDLVFLDISQSSLSTSSVRILCAKIASAPCSLQKVVLRNVSPADAYQNFCIILGGYETLTHLTLEGSDQSNMLPILCGALLHPKCNLQYLRLVSCSATAEQWADLPTSLETNHSLTCLNLTANEFQDEGAKLLYMILRHPKCTLQRLSLENCHLTAAYCKELASTLMVNQRLTHLCLAKNDLGDHGVRLLCEGLSYTECQLQTLVLFHCSITSDGCITLSALLQENSRLTHLDLGLNHIGFTGVKFLCEALRKPLCHLRRLWLWGCAITPFSCIDLSSALSSNQHLVSLDLGQNSLEYSGIKMLGDVLKLQSCPLQKLRLKMDHSDAQIQKLLAEIKEGNPKLTIERDNEEPKNNRPSSAYFIF